MHTKDYHRIDSKLKQGSEAVRLAKELIESVLANAYIRDVIGHSPNPAVFLQARERRSGHDRRAVSH